jgi:uncharacterized protein YbjT (DUF2867 family)
MTILVTGASGHLGHLVIDALLSRGATASDIVAGARTLSAIDDLAARGVAPCTWTTTTPPRSRRLSTASTPCC